MEALIFAAIVLLLLILAWYYFFSGGGPVVGTLPGGGSPTTPVDHWLTAPTQLTVGTQATFVFESLNNNPLAITGPQVTPIVGRTIAFTTTPGAVQIVSINGTAVNAATGTGTTAAPNGQITVIIVANSVPPVASGETVPQGAVIGIPGVTTSTRAVAKFTIVP